MVIVSILILLSHFCEWKDVLRVHLNIYGRFFHLIETHCDEEW